MAIKQCSSCERIFRKAEHLKRHERSHTRERPFQCRHCGKSFGRSDVLHRHVRGHGQAFINSSGEDKSMQSLSEALESNPVSVASLRTPKPSSLPARASSDSATALSLPAEISRAVDNTLSASPMVSSWYLEGENSHQQWNGPLHHDAGSTDAISGQTNSSMLPCSEPLLSWQPLDFDWNIDIPGFTDKTSPPGSCEPPLSPPTRLIGVSQDRFMKAYQAWGARFKGRPDDASIWRRIVDSPEGTMYWASDCKSTISHSRRVNKPCRNQLSRTFNNALATTHLSDDHGSGHPHVEFPSAETLEYALEQYFVYFHASLPFIHIPTFSAESAPTSLLLAMCLLGLIMLRNGSSSDFLQSAFEALARIITVDLTSISLIKERKESHLTLMAASLLLLQIAALLEHDGRVTQTYTLRTIVLSVAESLGLFSANEYDTVGPLLEHIHDNETRWKAWTRLESTRRLAMGLLEIDAWYSTYLAESPATRLESVSIANSSDDALFNAQSAEEWRSMYHPANETSPISLNPLATPPAASNKNTVSAFLLLLLDLHQKRTHHRLNLPPASPAPPYRAYITDATARTLVPTLTALGPSVTMATTTATLLRYHALHIRALAPLPLLSTAAGQHGPARAADALPPLRTWARTPAARRAMLHASQVFAALHARRVADGVAASAGLWCFEAGLALGLGILGMEAEDEERGAESVVDVFEPVDWAAVGGAGYDGEDGGGGGDGSDCAGGGGGAAVRFIREGGAFLAGGTMITGGRMAARRCLMHFTTLVDGLGRWKVESLAEVLRVLSRGPSADEVEVW